MTISSESWLLIGAIGFYLYDSIRLVAPEEVLLVKSFRGWSGVLPKGFFQVRGRNVYLPNPLMPCTALFQVDWLRGNLGINAANGRRPQVIGEQLKIFQILAMVLLVEMMVLLPVTATTIGLGVEFLSALILVYLTIFSVVYELHARKKALGLSHKSFLSISFDCIACPPFAINTVRKITKAIVIDVDLIKFASENFSSSEYAAFAASLNKEIQEVLDVEELSTSTASQLLQIQQKLDANINEH